jgi:hypothetical protein
VAVRHSNNTISLWKMPDAMLDFVDEMSKADTPENSVVILERVNGFMGNRIPGSRAGVLMENYGYLQGVCAALRLRTELVTPQEWQRPLGVGTKGTRSTSEWKNAIRNKICQRHPGLSPTLATSDALAILDYGITKYQL